MFLDKRLDSVGGEGVIQCWRGAAVVTLNARTRTFSVTAHGRVAQDELPRPRRSACARGAT